MGIFDFFKKQLSEVEQYYEERQMNGQNTIFEGNFRIVVEDVFTLTGRGTVVTGTVESGTVRVGDTVQLRRTDGSNRTVKIAGIEMFRKMSDCASQGENVGILLRDVARNEIGKGDVLEK